MKSLGEIEMRDVVALIENLNYTMPSTGSVGIGIAVLKDSELETVGYLIEQEDGRYEFTQQVPNGLLPQPGRAEEQAVPQVPQADSAGQQPDESGL